MLIFTYSFSYSYWFSNKIARLTSCFVFITAKMDAFVVRTKRATVSSAETVASAIGSPTECPSSQQHAFSSNQLLAISDSSGIVQSQAPSRDSRSSDLGDHSPAQPHIVSPPKTMFGKQSRSFQTKWYSDWSWLEYSVEKDSCFCFPCRKYLSGNDRDKVFTMEGFKNWKSATDKGKGFSKHCASKSHMLAVVSWEERKKFEKEGSALESLCNTQVENNRYYISRVFEIIKFLATNELPFRGKEEVIGDLHSGLFMKMMEYTMNIDAKFAKICKSIPENAKYTSPHFQNDVIGMMAQLLKEKSVQEIKETDTGLFTIKCDETRDAAGVELLSVVIRFVKKHGPPAETLLGLYELERFDADYITEQLLQALKDLDLQLLLAQCYDGASVMSGKHSGVQRRIADHVQRDVPYIHCFNHQLHLVVVHVCQKVDMVKEFFDVCQQLNDFLTRPKVRAVYSKSGAAPLARLMEHRWSGHFKTTNSIMENYDTIISTLDFFAEGGPVDMSVIAIGLKKLVTQEKFVFSGIVMREVLGALKPADKVLQSRECSVINGYQIVSETVHIIHNMRTKEKFSELLEVCKLKCCGDVEKLEGAAATAQLAKRIRKPPRSLDNFVVTTSTGQSNNQPLISVYFEIIDSLTNELERRFSECNSKLVESISTLLPCSEKFLDLSHLQPLTDLVRKTGAALDLFLLRHEVEVVRNIVKEQVASTCQEIRTAIDKFLEWFHRMELQTPFPNLHTLLCAALTIGASSATCEATFSTVARLLTPYRRCMNHERKCQLALLGFEKEKTAALSVAELMERFRRSSRRISV